MSVPSPSDSDPPEPLDEAMARWARQVRPPLLRAVALLAGAGMLIVLMLDRRRWPLAAVFAAPGCFALWGMIEHLADRRGPLLRGIQRAAAVIGTLAAVGGLLALLFWALGPAPIL